MICTIILLILGGGLEESPDANWATTTQFLGTIWLRLRTTGLGCTPHRISWTSSNDPKSVIFAIGSGFGTFALGRGESVTLGYWLLVRDGGWWRDRIFKRSRLDVSNLVEGRCVKTKT